MSRTMRYVARATAIASAVAILFDAYALAVLFGLLAIGIFIEGAAYFIAERLAILQSSEAARVMAQPSDIGRCP
jgi:hypothetical protein